MTARTTLTRGPAPRQPGHTATVTQLADRTPSAQRPELPTRADLDAATAAAIADPAAGPAAILRAAQAEEVVHLAYLRRPGADTELEAGL